MHTLSACLLAGALSLSLVACGGDDGGSDDNDAAATATTTTVPAADADALCGIRTSEEADPEAILALVEKAEAIDPPEAIAEQAEAYLWAIREAAENETIEPLLLQPVIDATADVDGWCNDNGELRDIDRASNTAMYGYDLAGAFTQTNTRILGDAPQISTGSLTNALAASVGIQFAQSVGPQSSTTMGRWSPSGDIPLSLSGQLGS